MTTGGRTRAGKNTNAIMATQTQRNEPLTEAQLDSINGSLTTIDSQLTFLVGITPIERRRLAKMGQKTRAFVKDAIAAGIRNPSMLPRSLDPDKMRGKMTLTDQLRELHARTCQLAERLGDTLTLAGSEMYEDARLIYKLTKTKATAPGLNSAAEGMSRRFAAQGRKSLGDSISALPKAA